MEKIRIHFLIASVLFMTAMYSCSSPETDEQISENGQTTVPVSSNTTVSDTAVSETSFSSVSTEIPFTVTETAVSSESEAAYNEGIISETTAVTETSVPDNTDEEATMISTADSEPETLLSSESLTKRIREKNELPGIDPF